MEFFCECYSDIFKFTPLQMDKLQEEFTSYLGGGRTGEREGGKGC